MLAASPNLTSTQIKRTLEHEGIKAHLSTIGRAKKDYHERKGAGGRAGDNRTARQMRKAADAALPALGRLHATLRRYGRPDLSAHRAAMTGADALNLMKQNPELLAAMAEPATEMLEVMQDIARDEGAPEAVRVRAAESVLRFIGYGAEMTAIESGQSNQPTVLSLLDDADRARLAREAAEVDLMPPLDAVEVSNG